MYVRIDDRRCRDQAMTGDRPRVGTDGEVDTVGDVGVSRWPHPNDPAVLDAEVAFHDAEQRIDHEDGSDHRVELGRGRRGVMLRHPRPPVLRVAPQRLIAGLGEVLFDPDPYIGVGETYTIAGGPPV